MYKNEVLENMKKIYRCMQMEARGCSNQCSTCEFFVSAPQRGSTVEAVIAMWEPSAPTAVEYIYTVVAENERKRGYEQAKAEYDHKLTEIKSRIKDHYYNKCKAVHKDKPIPCDNQTASCLWSGTRVCDYAREIDALPPVQSVIPIDWIESYAQMMVDDDRPIFAENIRHMIKEWEKEQHNES